MDEAAVVADRSRGRSAEKAAALRLGMNDGVAAESAGDFSDDRPRRGGQRSPLQEDAPGAERIGFFCESVPDLHVRRGRSGRGIEHREQHRRSISVDGVDDGPVEHFAVGEIARIDRSEAHGIAKAHCLTVDFIAVVPGDSPAFLEIGEGLAGHRFSGGGGGMLQITRRVEFLIEFGENSDGIDGTLHRKSGAGIVPRSHEDIASTVQPKRAGSWQFRGSAAGDLDERQGGGAGTGRSHHETELAPQHIGDRRRAG